MANFATIRTALITLLQTLTTVTSTEVYGYATIRPSGYPCITIETLGNEAEAMDEENIDRIYKYRVRIYVNMNKKQNGVEWAEATMLLVLDEIIGKIDGDYTLTNTVDRIEVTEIETGYAELAEGTMRTAEINLKIHKLNNIS